ncbi:hypothetical protein BI292_04810 [Pseudomonas sp. 43NM1]|uniref:Uncharacterized protein n=1 Tax=Pseudomonas gregormendelii TaxID=1628277 RepID=A0ABS3AQQ9_9PSED|nr:MULTISPECIES: hypothetical protein [Pseudomonas]MBN3968289.1 hypothetical protein [Pseudomonas gregormendelii]PKH14578.1 hypothetical protein BI292_04810 [Pseudomonas sp. 43NM1]
MIQGCTTYTTLVRMLGIQARTNRLGLDVRFEHTVLASRAPLDEIYNPILLDGIIQSGCFDDPESWMHGAFSAED